MNNIDTVVVDKLREALKSFSELKLVILFGSFATGHQNKDSDIDVAIAADMPLSVEKKIKMIDVIAQSVGRPVDLIDLQLKQEPVFSQAITKGSVIFCSDRQLYAELIKVVVFNAADFIPLRSRILKERRQSWINE